MPHSPRYKIYNRHGEYVAACKDSTDAGAILALYGEGAQIRDHDHRRVLYVNDANNTAADSYDAVADAVRAAIHKTKAPAPPPRFVSVVKMGRLASAAQGGHGVTRHAMPADDYHAYGHGAALCGTRPGRRSCGWISDAGRVAITCARCLEKLKRRGGVIVELEKCAR